MNGKRIPQTDSIAALARFWDTHELTGFEERLEKVGEPVFERGRAVMAHLSPEETAAVEELAAARGVDVADLIGVWVREKVRKR